MIGLASSDGEGEEIAGEFVAATAALL